jgi:radical SAM superfamily enzyme YgiQ (UPF0313 family)
MYDNSKFRAFSPQRIVQEMKELKRRYGVREVYFDDDIFTGNKAQVMALCRELKQDPPGLFWSIMGDAMVCDETMVHAMADQGLVAMKFGVESGDERVLKEIQKPIKFDRVARICQAAQQRHVKTHATFSFGLSGETRESMENTLSFMKRLDVDTLQVSIATPFPGTRFHERVSRLGQIKESSWDRFDGGNSSVVERENLTQGEIEWFASHARTRWLRHKVSQPAWIKRQASMAVRIGLSQGPRGLYRLARAGLEILRGPQAVAAHQPRE